jgi:hypothetical protein
MTITASIQRWIAQVHTSMFSLIMKAFEWRLLALFQQERVGGMKEVTKGEGTTKGRINERDGNKYAKGREGDK